MAGLEKRSLQEQLGTQRPSSKGQGSVLAVPSASKLSLRGEERLPEGELVLYEQQRDWRLLFHDDAAF